MKIAIIIYIPTPYRTDLFNYLCENFDYNFTIIYANSKEDNRNWDNDIKIKHRYLILKSKTIKIKKKMDFKYIHIPLNLKSTLNNLNPDIVIGNEYNPTVCLAYMWAKKNKKNIFHGQMVR